MTDIISDWFFSAPYEAPMVRRGDPLGLRLAAARYADALAPGLSNRTLDARWLTISAWMLVLANDVWRRRGNSAPPAPRRWLDDAVAGSSHGGKACAAGARGRRTSERIPIRAASSGPPHAHWSTKKQALQLVAN